MSSLTSTSSTKPPCAATLRQGIERMVRQEVPELENIIDVTDHAAGVTPYY